MQWALLSQQWKDEARWMTKGREWGSGLGPSWAVGVVVVGGGLGGARKLTGGGAAQRNVFIHRILSLMISLLACTQTYKNNTALIWHRVIITVWQTFQKNQIQANLMEHHSGKSPVPSRLKWSKTRNTNWSKGVSTFLPLSLMYTAGSIRHKCYDPGTPSGRITVQFSFSRHVTMILPSNVLFPFQIKQEDSTSEKKVPRDIIIIIIIIVDIYIHYVYIHTPNHRDTRTFAEKTPCFSHKVTHIRTLSPGAYLYNSILLCLSLFFSLFRKKKSNVDT